MFDANGPANRPFTELQTPIEIQNNVSIYTDQSVIIRKFPEDLEGLLLMAMSNNEEVHILNLSLSLSLSLSLFRLISSFIEHAS